MTTSKPTFPSLAVSGYSAPQKVKYLVLLRAIDFDEEAATVLNEWVANPTPEGLDAAYERALEEYPDSLQDARSEIRGGNEATGLPVQADYRMLRHYDATSVAAKMTDGSWVGWINWHGGGKHGNPDEIDWIDDAYHLDVSEEERVVIVRTFLKSPQ